MNTYTTLLEDGIVTTDDLDLALSDHTAAPFPTTQTQDDVEDDLDMARGLLANQPRSVHDGLANLAQRRRNHTPIPGVGKCLYHIRFNCWGINSLWGTAELAGLHGAPVHRYKSFNDAPRGMSLIFINSGVDHITVALGAGLNDTSDLHENGYNGVATIERTYDWCNATDWFGIETVNNVDCWPSPHKPKPKPQPWSLHRRLVFLHNEARRQRRDGHAARADQIENWGRTLAKKIGEPWPPVDKNN